MKTRLAVESVATGRQTSSPSSAFCSFLPALELSALGVKMKPVEVPDSNYIAAEEDANPLPPLGAQVTMAWLVQIAPGWQREPSILFLHDKVPKIISSRASHSDAVAI